MNPYLSPESAIPTPTIVRRRPTKTALVGAWLQLSQLVGFVVTQIAANRVYASIGEWMKGGTRDWGAISRAKDVVMTAIITGSCGGLIGCVLMAIAVYRQKCQPTWIVVLFWISSAHVLFVLLRATFVLVI